MNKIENVTIGISTFGPYPRAHYLIDSIRRNMTDKGDLNVNILLCDDGTPAGQLDDRRRFCQAMDKKMRNEMGVGVRLLEHGVNKGIPTVWNSIIAESPEAQAIVIFSDGVRIMMSGWLNHMISFLDLNEDIGTVGIPHVPDPNLYNPNEERWDGVVGKVGAATGNSFAFRPEVIKKIKNVDGSVGYWEDLLSFHEEIHGSLILSQMGYLSAMLPAFPSYYRGGLAFAAHPELIWRGDSPYLSGEEFVFWMKQSKWFVPQYMEYYNNNMYDKMGFSRIMFCKYWGILEECKAGRRYQAIKGEENVDILDDPPKFVHPQVVDTIPPRTVKWIDRHGVERSCDV